MSKDWNEADHIRFQKRINQRIIELENDLEYWKNHQPWRKYDIKHARERLHENKRWLMLIQTGQPIYH